MVERVVEVVRQRMAIAGLEMSEPVEGAAKGPGRVHPVIVGQVVAHQRLTEDAHDSLDRFLELGVARARVAVGRCVEPGPIAHDLAPGPTHRPNGIVLRHSHRRRLEAGRE